jgi:potassium efflux system protein
MNPWRHNLFVIHLSTVSLFVGWVGWQPNQAWAQLQLIPPVPVPQPGYASAGTASNPPATALPNATFQGTPESRVPSSSPMDRVSQTQPPMAGNVPSQRIPGNPPASLNSPVPSPSSPAALPSQQIPSLSPVSEVTTLTIETVTALLQQLNASNDLEPTIKQSLLTIYEALLADLKNRVENDKFYKELLSANEVAPAATAEAKKRKENPNPKIIFTDGILQSYSIERLQSVQLELQSLVQTAADGRARVESAIVSRDSQKKELPRLISEAKAAIGKLNDELNAPSSEGTDPRVREAALKLSRARLVSLNERVRRFEQEQRTYDAENELLSLQKGIFSSEEKVYQSKLKEVTEELNKRREILIGNQRKLAERLVTLSVQDLKPTALHIVKRSEDWLELAKQNALLRLETDASRGELKLWTDRFRIMTERISPDASRHVTNFNSWVGLMLRKQRNELPDIGELTQKLYDYQQRIFATETLILELDDWKAASSSHGEPTSFSIAAVDSYGESDRRDQSRLLNSFEHRIVDEFRVDANSYFESLFNLAETTQQTIDQVKRYRAFIDEHILWIRSSEAFGQSDMQQVWPALQWLFQIRNWSEIPKLILADARHRFWGYLVGSILFGLLVINLRNIKRESFRQGELASKPNCSSLLPTLQTITGCVLLAAPLAVLHVLVGWRLHNTSESSTFAEAIGMGLMVSARYFFPLELMRQISRAGGLAESHFHWSAASTQLLRKNLRWFIDLAIPCVCVVGILSEYGEAKYENSLGRIIYCLLMVLSLGFLLICFHPNRGVFREYLRQNAGGWIDRLKYVWYGMMAAGPIGLIAMSMTGYHYTSVRLAMHLHTTFVSLIGLLLLASLIQRWLLLRRRQILVAQAKQRLEEARRRDPNAPSSLLPTVDSQLDLATINAQTMRLVRSSLLFAAIGAVAFIWSGVLPAVGVLDSVKLGWSVEGATPTARIPITLTHLLVAIPMGIMTIVAARNLPGLLEIALLQHLPLENAVRYAISTISRYAILILGLAMTFNSIGVHWSSIQWLVAALGVGLGFGLQEIFANFVSGLILLFEQPVRVGDVITLGDTTGTVSRIRMRATTVTNFDQQELVIPNKDLITGRLLNWTLTDSTNRLVFQVGIAYDSDPELACSLIREVCSLHPNVMKEPAPTAFFEQFGDSTLDIKVRLFLTNLDLRLPTKHELHLLIRKKFLEAGIEIAFPQRDLHLRSLPPVLAKFLQNGDASWEDKGEKDSSEAPNEREARTRVDFGVPIESFLNSGRPQSSSGKPERLGDV